MRNVWANFEITDIFILSNQFEALPSNYADYQLLHHNYISKYIQIESSCLHFINISALFGEQKGLKNIKLLYFYMILIFHSRENCERQETAPFTRNLIS